MFITDIRVGVRGNGQCVGKKTECGQVFRFGVMKKEEEEMPELLGLVVVKEEEEEEGNTQGMCLCVCLYYFTRACVRSISIYLEKRCVCVCGWVVTHL
jgi:hypothetical protein